MDYVIIGGSAAGVTAAETLRKHDQKANVTLISDEALPLYSRCLLTYLIAGSLDENGLIFKDQDFYQKNNIRTYLGKKAVSLNCKIREITLDDKTKIRYDKLLLATGASAKLLDVPGVNRKGVFTLRRIDDARAILAMLDQAEEIAVLGGGLIGLRDAYALRKKGKQVSVVVKSPQVLSQTVDAQAAGIIACCLEQHGVKISTGVAASEIVGKTSVEGVTLDSGKRLTCQLVIIGKGVNPNTELAASCGLQVEDGVVVDQFLRSSDENIFAAGDLAQTYDMASETKRINALWPCAVEQGQIAALNMMGKQTPYAGSLAMNSVDFFGLACISMGVTKPKKEQDYEVMTQIRGNVYKKFVLKENRIVGAVFVGNVRTAGIISALIKNRIDVSTIKDKLSEDDFNYAKIMPLVVKNRDKFKQEDFQDTIITY